MQAVFGGHPGAGVMGEGAWRLGFQEASKFAIDGCRDVSGVLKTSQTERVILKT